MPPLTENPQFMVYCERLGSPGDKRPVGVADTLDEAFSFLKKRMTSELSWVQNGAPLYDMAMYYIVPVERIPSVTQD